VSASIVTRDQELKLREELRLSFVLDSSWEAPHHLLAEISVVDPKSGKKFGFSGMLNPDDGWAWQRDTLDWWMANDRTLILKARQIGVTWLGAALALWYIMFRPGSRVLIYSIGETEAKLVIRRIWMMYQGLPEQLKRHINVVSPKRAQIPSEEIVFQHSATELSSLRALSSTSSAGHSETATLVMLDEYSRNPYAQEIWKGSQPTMSGGGKTIIMSTANGIAGNFDGSNFFYSLWNDAEERRIKKLFLGWNKHPDRDQQWYDDNAGTLPPKDRAESFPSTPEEAFQGTGDCWFDPDAMLFYRSKQILPQYRFNFDIDRDKGGAKVRKSDEGLIRVYAEPEESKEYVISVDPAGGSGLDYSAVYVLDLHTQSICAEIRSSVVRPDVLAEFLYYLGNWFNKARIAVERAGGFHAVIITELRRGGDGRQPYPRIYKHRDSIRPDELEEMSYGFPLTQKTRPQVVAALEEAVRERSLPYVTEDLYAEMMTFGVYENKAGNFDPSKPQAAPGCHDDTVMSLAIAMYMYQLYGKGPLRGRKTTRNEKFANARLQKRRSRRVKGSK
jgi:hypothetical protein